MPSQRGSLRLTQTWLKQYVSVAWGHEGLRPCSKVLGLQEHPTEGQKACLGSAKTTAPGQEALAPRSHDPQLHRPAKGPEEPACPCFLQDEPLLGECIPLSPSTPMALSLSAPVTAGQTIPAWLSLKFTSNRCGKTIHLERV